MRIIDGGPREFSTLAFGELHPATMNFLQNQVNNSSITERLTEAGREFMDRGRQYFDHYYGSEAMRLTRAAIRTVQHMFDPNVIRALDDIGALQQAPAAMQRWVMAQPQLRSLYHMHRCDGYSDTYVDYHPGDVGENHADWRMVTTGIVTADDNGDWCTTVYMEEGDANDAKLCLSDQLDILSTWDVIEHFLSHGKEDPSDRFAGPL